MLFRILIVMRDGSKRCGRTINLPVFLLVFSLCTAFFNSSSFAVKDTLTKMVEQLCLFEELHFVWADTAFLAEFVRERRVQVLPNKVVEGGRCGETYRDALLALVSVYCGASSLCSVE